MKIILWASFLFLFVACKKNPDTVEMYYDYFPLEEGTFVEYDVTYIQHDPKSDTVQYRLKTVIGDTVIDNSGRVARKFFRYIYDTLDKEYKVKDLWTAIIDQGRAELAEENQRMIKLVFAPTSDKEWDINAFNSYDPLLAYYEDIHKSFEINGLSFDKTVKVVQEYEEPNLIEYKNKYEIYAKGVGLVEKFYIDITFQNFQISKPTKGEEIYYKAINYGKE